MGLTSGSYPPIPKMSLKKLSKGAANRKAKKITTMEALKENARTQGPPTSLIQHRDPPDQLRNLLIVSKITEKIQLMFEVATSNYYSYYLKSER